MHVPTGKEPSEYRGLHTEIEAIVDWEVYGFWQ